MIKPQDLRIGNLVGYASDNCDFIVNELKKESLTLQGVECEYKNLIPIPLTEEWLVKFGFPENGNTRDLLFNYIIYFERQDNKLYLCNNQTKVQYLIEWVHEYQNIYFSLTGQELTI